MVPTLRAGDVVLGDRRAYHKRLPQPGEIVVALHPQQHGVWIIKRLVGSGDTGGYLLASDNAVAGTDSRTFGPVMREQIVARVTAKTM